MVRVQNVRRDTLKKVQETTTVIRALPGSIKIKRGKRGVNHVVLLKVILQAVVRSQVPIRAVHLAQLARRGTVVLRIRNLNVLVTHTVKRGSWVVKVWILAIMP